MRQAISACGSAFNPTQALCRIAISGQWTRYSAYDQSPMRISGAATRGQRWGSRSSRTRVARPTTSAAGPGCAGPKNCGTAGTTSSSAHDGSVSALRTRCQRRARTSASSTASAEDLAVDVAIAVDTDVISAPIDPRPSSHARVGSR